MRAAFTVKPLMAFEKKTGRRIESASGGVIHIQTFRLMLYAGRDDDDDEQRLLEKQRRRRHRRGRKGRGSGPAQACPKRIRDANNGGPQFWMLITKFAYIGGDGNAIFNQPTHIKYDPRVAEQMAMLLARTRETKEAPCPGNEDAGNGQAGPIAPMEVAVEAPGPEECQAYSNGGGNAGAEAEDGARKRLRLEDESDDDPSPLSTPSMPRFSQLATQLGPLTTSAIQSSAESGGSQWPTVGHVPFVQDVEAAWACAAMWQALSIQVASIPAMPICRSPCVSEAGGAEQQPAAHDFRSSSGHAPVPAGGQPACGGEQQAVQISRADRHGRHGNQQSTSSAALSPPAGGDGKPRRVAADTLGGLLEADGADLRSGGTMMDAMYRVLSASSPVLVNDDDDGSLVSGSSGVDAEAVLRDSLGWNGWL
ncbi:hypothetical protein GGF46_001018 [Coemansia sp. RSA 552]|nr:hypothetical protein GGF46_001018 [Coemansia sp. RSA 552]